MSYLTWGTVLLGATAGFSGAGYFASTFFNGDKPRRQEGGEVHLNEKRENPNLWEYVLLYGGGAMCDFQEVGQSKSDKESKEGIFQEIPVICQTTWAKSIVERNKGKKGLWIMGDKDKLEEIMGNTDSLINNLSFNSLSGEWTGKSKKLNELDKWGCNLTEENEGKKINLNCQVFD
ncbi:hypothetical protein [Mycoplasma suis]|uniref:Uncharacterized protein n=1 Tax=Mycoplasma suis (strain Illinois) TaxID=768700 RepID=F0QRN2_MYCSL|nr:hypothetical protein [Mycoplasma suis]ADX98152.1 hypothetical protein MSU_0620 [Mycoplasma suis str. Illinois]